MSGPMRIFFIAIFLFCEGILCKKIIKKPTILVGMLIRNKGHTLPYFLSFLEALNYPKDRMTLCIRSDNNIDNTLEILRYWLKKESHKYHAVDLMIDEESTGLKDEKGIADWPPSRFRHVINLREGILNFGRKIWADYIFMLDADVLLTNPSTLNHLISKKKTVVAPLVKSNGMYSNFWAGMTEDYYDDDSTDSYEPILDREDLDCHEVSMVHSVLLIDMRKFDSDHLTYDFENLKNYDGPHDDIVTFAISAEKSDVSLHVCNDKIYGYVLKPLEIHESLASDMEQLVNLKLEILAHQTSLEISEGMRKFVKYPKRDTLNFDKIYFINLQRRPERRARMEQCFQELGILAERINAVDGRTLNETTLDEWGVKIMPNYSDPYLDRPMKMGEIGCFLSHYVVWKKILDNDYKRVMILEDDILFEPYFRNQMTHVFNEIERLKLDWDLIYLGRISLLDDEEPLVNGSKFLLHPGYSYSAAGYILSQSGVKKLLEARPLDNMIPVDEYFPILYDRHPSDAWKEYFPHRDLVALSVTPLLIYTIPYDGEIEYASDTDDSKVVPDNKIMQAKEEL